MEIDENLTRAELSPADEAGHIARRKVLRDEMRKVDECGVESGTTSPTLATTGRGHKQFAAEVAEITGVTKRDVNKKLRRANELGDSLRNISGTTLDSGVEMDALIKLPEPERKQLIERAATPHHLT